MKTNLNSHKYSVIWKRKKLFFSTKIPPKCQCSWDAIFGGVSEQGDPCGIILSQAIPARVSQDSQAPSAESLRNNPKSERGRQPQGRSLGFYASVGFQTGVAPRLHSSLCRIKGGVGFNPIMKREPIINRHLPKCLCSWEAKVPLSSNRIWPPRAVLKLLWNFVPKSPDFCKGLTKINGLTEEVPARQASADPLSLSQIAFPCSVQLLIYWWLAPVLPNTAPGTIFWHFSINYSLINCL